MKCYYIAIAYLPGYSRYETFLKCTEKGPGARLLNFLIP